jgi:hypothetical protein
MTAQPLIAPAEAQAVRRERTAHKRRLAATRPRAAAIGAGLAVLASPTPRVAGLSIRELLVAVCGAGRARAQMVLDLTRVDPATALGGPTVDGVVASRTGAGLALGCRPTSRARSRRATPIAARSRSLPARERDRARRSSTLGVRSSSSAEMPRSAATSRLSRTGAGKSSGR